MKKIIIALLFLSGCASMETSQLLECKKVCRNSNVQKFQDDNLTCACYPAN